MSLVEGYRAECLRNNSCLLFTSCACKVTVCPELQRPVGASSKDNKTIST